MQTFIDFVANQPQDKKINHYSWHSCAVGEYVSSIHQDEINDSSFDPSAWNPQMSICLGDLRDLRIPKPNKDLTLYDVLNSGAIDGSIPEGHNIETYGGLHNLIQWCIKEQ